MPRFLLKKRVLIPLVAIITVVVSFTILNQRSSQYVLGKAELRSLTELVTESGLVSTAGKVNIYSPTNGVIDAVFVTNGQTVTSGQKLFSVKSTATSQEKAAAWSTYQAAIVGVQQAENNRRLYQATVDRVHDDLKNHDKDETFSQKETRVTAEVAYDNTYDDLLAAQAALDSARSSYFATQNSTVTTPVSGIITNLSVIPGTVVLANSVLAPTTPVVAVSGLGQSEVVITVGESDINRLRVGQIAEIKFDAVTGEVFPATISRLDDFGTLNQGVVRFNVYLQLQPDSRIKSGMTADVDIVTNKTDSVLTVPNTAIKPYQKGRAVRILTAAGQLDYLPVQIGVRGKDYTQITSGLTEGQQIITSLSNEKKGRNSMFSF